MNKLANEKSPYLLQHAHNPVDWLPWGEAAFEKSRTENKPIFLSIGYSTCHWCHVMERESFENPDTARLMNEYFINVKVDREERPDVDRLYMTFVQATTGSGGWPLSVFLTPDLKPFFGGTYFPPQNAYGRIGFPELLERIHGAWQNDRENIVASGENVMSALAQYASPESRRVEQSADWTPLFDSCFDHLRGSYDARYGGFGDAPKFPRPVSHDFLHRYATLTGQPDAVPMSERTLRAMADGGMFDHLGGGFHRYSVDSQWIVSHFEKMLYDQAQLVVSYLEMFQITGDEYFAAVARRVLDYVLRDMTHPDGGFFAAEDADSLPDENATHKEEGAFYVWTQNEIETILDADEAGVFNEYYGVRANGNAPREGDPHGEFAGKNILYRVGEPDDDTARVLTGARAKLFAARENRPRPHRDEKIIVAWNGLMISAFARAAAVLGEPRYVDAAKRATAFIHQQLWDESTRALRRHFKDGAADVPAFAEDYAFLVRGLLDLYEANGDIEDLQWAETLNDALLENFWDEQGSGLFSSVADPRVLLRFKEDYDGAEPSPNSVAADNCVRLWHLLDRTDLQEKADAIFRAFAGRLQAAAPAMPFLLGAKMRSDAAPLHIVIAGNKGDTKQLWQVAHEKFLPHKTIVLLDDESREYFVSRLPFVAEMRAIEGRATAYVCREFACRQPVTATEELRAQLAG